METQRWHEVDRLFEEALDRPPAERAAFLDATCAGDTALRRDVERLLAADEQGSGFLASPPDELLRLTLDDREEGGSLGPSIASSPSGRSSPAWRIPTSPVSTTAGAPKTASPIWSWSWSRACRSTSTATATG
jgi:hypothetical protein